MLELKIFASKIGGQFAPARYGQFHRHIQVYGDNAFFKKYYLNESDKLKAVNDVKEFFAEWNLKKSYQAISKYLNFRINGKLICGEIYYPQIDNNEN